MIDRHIETIKVQNDEILKRHLSNCLKSALEELYVKDIFLIVRNDSHLYERSIVFRLGLHLHHYLQKDKYLNGYDLDCEYDRNMDYKKTLPSWQNGCIPDLIIHKRGSNEYNLLVVECKGWWSQNNRIEEDKRKIREFLESLVYRYKFGLMIHFGEDEYGFEWITV